MTKVFARKSGDRYTLRANGHATGSSEVCAAVSGILYALAGYVQNSRDGSTFAYDDRMASGSVNMDFRGGPGARGAFEMAVIGLLQIARQYPDYIQVEYLQNS